MLEEASEDVKFHNVRNAPFELYNLYGEQDEIYRRLPKAVAEATSAGVNKLAKETAGVRVRFSTDSGYILIKTKMPVIARNSHMTLLMSGCPVTTDAIRLFLYSSMISISFFIPLSVFSKSAFCLAKY